MQINTIILSQQPQRFNYYNNQTQQDSNNNLIKEYNPPYYVPFMSRVPKNMARFYEVNAGRIPYTLKSYIDSLGEQFFSISPLEAQKNAFKNLTLSKTIEDVKNNFPAEKLFDALVPMKETKAINGLLGIYREYKDIYENGILNSREDLSIYLLKKIFIESKTIDEINIDLDTDLMQDIRDEFKRRQGNSEYIHSSTLKSLGIQMPDSAFMTSLRFTREGYSDQFGTKISEGQLRYWNSLNDEEKFEVLSKRLEGRDNWWNNLTYDEKLEYAAGIESEEELFKDYKKYVSLQKRRKVYGNVGEEGSSLNQVQLTKKKISVGSKLQHKDIFNLWMKKNLENFYNRLSEADKDIVHIKRIRRLTARWKNMTAAERTELINKMREGREPLQFIMIDAWNHSHNIIKSLSIFLKEKQILKPADMLYSSEGFSKFQSEIMTEFWETHPEFAAEFGENIKKSQEKIQDSINRGLFQDLKQEILRDRAFRKNLIDFELQKETQKGKTTPEKDIKSYQEEFKEFFGKSYNRNKVLPKSYINDLSDIIIKNFPEELVLEFTKSLKNDEVPSEEIIKLLNEVQDIYIHPELAKIQHALENAIASVLKYTSFNNKKNLFELSADQSIIALEKHVIHQRNENKSEKFIKDELNKIEKLYSEYKKDLPIEKLHSYVLNFFIPESLKNTDINKLTDYIASYGNSISILFSEQSAHSPETKIALKNKFYNLMPDDLKEKYIFLFEKDSIIRNEKYVKQIDTTIKQRFSFIDKKFTNMYLAALKKECRYFGDAKDEKIVYQPGYYLRYMGNNGTRKTIMGEVLNIPVPRNHFGTFEMYRLLAMEQAMADELFDASNDEEVYKLTFEALVDLFEQIETVKKKPKSEQKLIINDMYAQIHSKELKLNDIPNKMNINQRYREYCEDFDTVLENAKNEKRELDDEDIMCWLNPDENNKLRDTHVMKRINYEHES